jgi:multicomponent Na+:H+ antiporter subunit D
VDAVVNGIAGAILRGGGVLRQLQTGVVTHYALAMITGVIAATAVFAVAWR